MIRRLFVCLAAVLCLSCPGLTRAQTTEVDKVKYDNDIQLGGTKVHLNGAGIRYKAIFKVYTAGLYLASKASTTEAVLAAPGPKRLLVVMLREIDGNELGKLFTRGMEQNLQREEFSKSIPGIMRISEAFALRRKLLPGDQFSIDWVPGVGTQLYVMGSAAGEPIREPEFFSAMMKIWLGKSPADSQLKDALLGKPAGGINMSTY